MVKVVEQDVSVTYVRAVDTTPGKIYKDNYGGYYLSIMVALSHVGQCKIYAVNLDTGAHVSHPEYSLIEVDASTIVIQGAGGLMK